MLDINQIGTLLMEEQYPILSDTQLTMLATTYDNIYQACYVGALMKAQTEDITVGPISIKSDSNFWKNLADSFYRQWQLDPIGAFSRGRSITGMTINRSDE